MCPSDSVLTCSKAVTGVRPCQHAVCIRKHPSQKVMHPPLHSSVLMFCGFVHCIVHFPCTILQVAIVLNTIFSLRDSGSIVHVCFVSTIRLLRFDMLYFGFLPPLCCGRRGAF